MRVLQGRPEWLQALIAKGALGQKTKCGIYRKQGRQIQVLDLHLQDYRESGGGEVFPEVAEIPQLRTRRRSSPSSPRTLIRRRSSCGRSSRRVHYCAVHLGDIADSARDIDLAMRWGFGWAQGPFETWQAAGWRAVAEMMRDDIAHGRAMSAVPAPAWVFERDGVHAPAGSQARRGLAPPRPLPVYQRQLYPRPRARRGAGRSRRRPCGRTPAYACGGAPTRTTHRHRVDHLEDARGV